MHISLFIQLDNYWRGFLLYYGIMLNLRINLRLIHNALPLQFSAIIFGCSPWHFCYIWHVFHACLENIASVCIVWHPAVPLQFVVFGTFYICRSHFLHSSAMIKAKWILPGIWFNFVNAQNIRHFTQQQKPQGRDMRCCSNMSSKGQSARTVCSTGKMWTGVRQKRVYFCQSLGRFSVSGRSLVLGLVRRGRVVVCSLPWYFQFFGWTFLPLWPGKPTDSAARSVLLPPSEYFHCVSHAKARPKALVSFLLLTREGFKTCFKPTITTACVIPLHIWTITFSFFVVVVF